MYSLDVVAVVFVVFLNVLIGYSLDSLGFTSLLYISILPLLSSVCGFLVSSSRSLVVVFVEFLYLATAISMRSRLELAAALLLPYILGAATGLTRRRSSLELDFRTPTSYYSIALSLGFSLVGTALLKLTGTSLNTPLTLLLEGDVSLGVLTSLLATYTTQAYIASTLVEVNLAALAIASALPPYTLPLLPLLQKPAHLHLRKHCLKLGRVVEVIRGARARELLIPFEKGINRNIVVVGATGTGKTTLARRLVNQIKQLNISTVIFDPHGEYCRSHEDYVCVDASKLSVDMFRARGEDPEGRAEFITEAISELYSLGSLQRIALFKILVRVFRESSSADFSNLLDYLWRISQGELDLGIPSTVVRSLIPYVEKLEETFKLGDREISEYLNSVTIVDYSKLSGEVATVVAELIIDELYYTSRDSGRELVLIIDEAHRFLRKSRAISRVFKEGRKYGISSILITQNLSDIPREVILNSAVLVSFSVPEITEARYLAKLVSPDNHSLYEKILSKLTLLPQFHAFVSISGSGTYVVKTQGQYLEK